MSTGHLRVEDHAIGNGDVMAEPSDGHVRAQRNFDPHHEAHGVQPRRQISPATRLRPGPKGLAIINAVQDVLNMAGRR